MYSLLAICLSLGCARIHLGSLSESTAGSPRFRRSIPLMRSFSGGTSVSLSLLGFFACFFSFFFIGMDASWNSVLFTYYVAPANLAVLPCFFAATGAGLFFIVWTLCGILRGVLVEYFSLFRRVTRAMQQAFFSSGCPITRMACISCLALSSAALLGVGG